MGQRLQRPLRFVTHDNFLFAANASLSFTGNAGKQTCVLLLKGPSEFELPQRQRFAMFQKQYEDARHRFGVAALLYGCERLLHERKLALIGGCLPWPKPFVSGEASAEHRAIDLIKERFTDRVA